MRFVLKPDEDATDEQPTGDRELPESAIALQLRYVTDPGAVLDLIAILESAPGDLTPDCVLTALGEKLKDPRVVPGLATHLSDPAPSASYRALDEQACTLPTEWKEQDVEPQGITLQNLAGASWKVARLVAKLGQSASNRNLLLVRP